MKTKIIILASIITMMSILGGCASSGGVRQDPPSAAVPVITDITIGDDLLEIKASGPFVYSIYKPSDPYRLTIDMPDVSVGQFKDRIVSRHAGFSEVSATETVSPKTMTKIEVLLQAPLDVEPLYHDNTLTLRVKGNGERVRAMAAGAPPSDPITAGGPVGGPDPDEKAGAQGTSDESVGAQKQEVSRNAEETAPSSRATEITDIYFTQKDGVVNLIIKGDGSMNPAVFTLKDRIVIDIPDVTLKARMPSTVISPVKGVRAGKHKDRTRLVLDLREMKGFDVTSVGNSVVVAIQGSGTGMAVARPEVPREQKEPEQKKTAMQEKKNGQKMTASQNTGEVIETKVPETIAEGRYTGERISLDFQDADIVPIFRLLSDISGYNIVVSPEVKGRLTLKLINVPWDQALDIILRTFSLGESVEGNIIRIAPHAVFARESEERARAKEAEIRAEDLETIIFPISYGDMERVRDSIKDAKILSPRGSMSIDKRTSSLVITDTRSAIVRVEDLLKTLDRPTPQVMIEARIVEVNTDDVKALGIQWGLSISASNALAAFTGFPSLTKGVFTGQPFLVDLPSGASAAGSGSGFTFGLMNPSKTVGLDLQIDALEKVGRSRIISNPRVVTTDNILARIMQGTSEPYPKVEPQSGQITTDYKDVVLITEVTPHITPAGSVSMAVLVRKEDVIGQVNIGGSLVPRTSKIESGTTVLVQSGETLVIGGVYKKTETDANTGVPGLMNIPVLGWLFKSIAPQTHVQELLIFITPKILERP
ncbi:MAG TPA: type IV pilus secretin PilQ [Thermodesulfovibrionales bacterium]|nr:type IV pilus secretin PilQ [Thermodesulfovibrionales bacterium]